MAQNRDYKWVWIAVVLTFAIVTVGIFGSITYYVYTVYHDREMALADSIMIADSISSVHDDQWADADDDYGQVMDTLADEEYESDESEDFESDFNPGIDYGEHTLSGYFESDGVQYPVEVSFRRVGDDILDCVYRNINYNVTLNMAGTLTSDGFLLEGNAGGSDFYISVSEDYDDGGWTGTSRNGNKTLKAHFY